jgi:uncharacterized LabA/DUF88 family protein
MGSGKPRGFFGDAEMSRVAILIDGSFYQRRARILKGDSTPEERARELINYCYSHLSDKNGNVVDELYRIFYYGCPPASKKVRHPLTKRDIDLSQTLQYTWANEFIKQMMKQRKVALRLGRLSEETAGYILTEGIVKKLCSGSIKFQDLKEDDFELNIKQKGVDMKIGVDISSLAYKKQADKIILIAGDSDFVPASKLARREGIDFVLDPMWNNINPDLYEHIDGLTTCWPKPHEIKKQTAETS